MPVSEATYERLALEDVDGQWEYLCGQLRQKWRKRPDGSYSETTYSSGEVPGESLPGVVMKLESLFR